LSAAPGRGTALLFHPSPEARTLLGEALTRLGFEAIPLGQLKDLERFAAALAPGLVLLPPEAFDEVVVPGLARRLTVVALGQEAEEDEQNEASKARARAIHLPLAGVDSAELARRIDLVLLARQVGLEVDESSERLVGTISRVPFLEAAQRLAGRLFSGRLELGAGAWLAFSAGRPIAARAGKVSGLKAFCRLARLLEGELAVVPGEVNLPPDLEGSIDVLVQQAFSDMLAADHLVAPLDPAARLRIELGPGFFEQEFSPVEKQLLTLAQKPTPVGAALDAIAATDGEISQQIGQLVQRGFLLVEKRAPPVRIVSDSTADLTAELARAAGIVLAPLRVQFGDQVFRDRVDLQPGQFYDLLAKSKHHPKSSPPTVEDFEGLYRQLQPHSDLVSVHISSQLSLTAKNAAQAAKSLTETSGSKRSASMGAIEIVDSRQAGLGLGMLALFASRLAARGEGAAAIAARLRELGPRVHLLFGVDTLEYLVKGGRLSKAAGFFGTMLGIKPILGLHEGAIVPLDKVRGARAVQPRLLELLARMVDPKQPIFAAVLHGAAPAAADRLRKLLLERFRCAEVLVGEMGPVVGTHAGPGAVGVAALQPKGDELRLLAP
jgi:DegV family protein with EDD domain